VRAADLAQFHGRTVDDLLGPDTRLLVVGINPSLWTAAVNAHFASATGGSGLATPEGLPPGGRGSRASASPTSERRDGTLTATARS
jgi:hypothetical protein